MNEPVTATFFVSQVEAIRSTVTSFGDVARGILSKSIVAAYEIRLSPLGDYDDTIQGDLILRCHDADRAEQYKLNSEYTITIAPK